MGGIWGAVLVHCVVSVAVVSGDEDYIVVFDSLSNDFLYTAVDALDSLDDSVIYTCVADHVTICVVQDNEIFLVAVDSFDKFLGNDRCAHFRLEVVGRNLRRRNQNSVLVLERSLAAAVEEECHVSIFLSLCDTELTETCFRYDFSESVFYDFLVEEDVKALECSIVWSHAAVVEVRDDVHSLLRHILLCEN